jgi:sporulation protein YlmC with PRC-barrel domain
MFPGDLRIGAEVFSSGGDKLGELQRLVLRRSDLSLTHVVVDVGFLRSGHSLWQGGLGLEYDRVVPVEAVASVTDERVDLGLTAGQFKDAPEYTQERYEGQVDLSPGEYDITDFAQQSQAIAGLVASTPGAYVSERLNKPLDSVDVREGLQVWRNRPHQKLGEVERGLFDSSTGQLQALVVRRGFLLTRDVILPSRYITEVIDDVSVRVEIADRDLEKLKGYEA